VSRWIESPALRRAIEKAPQRPERVTSVYVIKIGPLYKIGLSVDPQKRIKAMQLPQKPDVVRLYQVSKARELEAVLHKRFAPHREWGEWFVISESALAEIDACVETWKRTARYAA
jgi:hypothetical protein